MNLNISRRNNDSQNSPSLLMRFAYMSPQKKLICLTSFLFISAWCINTLFAPEGDEIYNNHHLNRAKNRPQIDLGNIDELKKEATPDKPPPASVVAVPSAPLDVEVQADDYYTPDNTDDEPLFPDDEYDDDMFFDDAAGVTDDYDDATDDIVSDYVALFRASDIEEQLESVSDSDLLHDWMAPQGRAFQWIVNEDERMVNANDPYLVQRYALAVIFHSTLGDNWDNDGSHWMTLLHECYWNKKVKGKFMGVTECDENKKVTRIDLSENNLQGSLPTELGLLESLKTVNFDSNRITGKIPNSITALTNLTSFSVESNRLTGKIPSKISELVNIAELKLNHNEFSGSIPASVCALREQSLYLLWADCDDHGHAAAVKCKCCTECCDGLDMCYSQIPLDDDFVE